jgi:hypothetical protein
VVDALFIPDGDRYLPTELTRGGWSDDAQHGGPPVGLAAHVIESRHGSPDMVTTRLTTDLVRPVPLAPLTVHSRVIRPGRRIQVIEAIMAAGDLEVALVTALMIRVAEIDLPERPESGWVQPGLPHTFDLVETRLWTGDTASLTRFHHDAIEIRTFEQSFSSPGPGTSWLRLRCEVIAGTPPSPFVRTATLADVGNGNSTSVDPREWMYVNPDVALALHRPLRGDWLGMRSVAHQHATGIGLAESVLFDEVGPIGTVTQSQLIERRR